MAKARKGTFTEGTGLPSPPTSTTMLHCFSFGGVSLCFKDKFYLLSLLMPVSCLRTQLLWDNWSGRRCRYQSIIIISQGFREVIIRSNNCSLRTSSYPQLRRRSLWRREKERFHKRICAFDVHFDLYFVTGFKSVTIWLFCNLSLKNSGRMATTSPSFLVFTLPWINSV